MENKNTAPKIKNEEFKIEEIISATSGRTVRGVDYVDNYDKIANALRNSSDYKYDDKKSLVENIYEAFPQYKLKEVTEKFSALMESWKGQDTTFINNAMNAKVMAINAGIPQVLTIKVKEKEVKKQKAAAREPDNNVPNNKDSEPKKATLHVITGRNIPWDWSDSKHFR